MKYPSKKGIIWYGTVILMLALTSFGCIGLFSIKQNVIFSSIIMLIIIGCDIVLVWMHFDTWYAIQEEYLEIKCACFTHLKIAYQDILEVIPSISYMAGSALSIDRVCITCIIRKNDYGKEDIFISPIQKNEFIIELKEKMQFA